MDRIPTPEACLSTSPIQRATQLWLATRTTFGPPPKSNRNQYTPQFSWQEHLQWTLSLGTSYAPKSLDPTLKWAVQHAHLFHPVAEFRRQVADEICDLVIDTQDDCDRLP